MTYAPTWTNGAGRLAAAEHFICLSDAAELAAAINRRRLLTYQLEQNFSSDVAAGKYVRAATLAAADAPPFDNLRYNLTANVLNAPTGTLGGWPATPQAMEWLWPIAGDDENKIIVASAPGAGEVSLFGKLNEAYGWTDSTLTAGETGVRDVHFNELRQVVEWLSRGRWTLPVYLSGGLFSILPDTPWLIEVVANNGSAEVRSVGFVVLRIAPDGRGLTNVTIRPTSRLELTADVDCAIDIFRCQRAIDFVNDPPTWNSYAPSASGAWGSPGGLGSGDAASIGSIGLIADEPASLTGSGLAAAIQAMIDGAEQNFLFRRSDTGYETVTINATLVVEFDLASPPN
jgi:hypothetical protein